MGATGALRKGKFAAKMATGGGLSAPLLPGASGTTDDPSSDGSADAGSDAGAPPRKAPLTGKSLATGLLAAGGLATSAVAVALAPGAATAVMGAVCLWNAPVMARSQVRIAGSSSVRDSINQMREQRDHLAGEVDFMSRSVDDLQEETQVLKGLEENLAAIADKQGTNVGALVDLVNENELILTEVKGKMRQMFVQTMLQIVMRSDDDGDMKIERKEVHMLSLRLQIQLDPYGVKLDTERFEEMIREDNDISHVCKFCGELLFADAKPADADDDDASVDSEATPDLEAFCQGLGDSDDEEPPMTYDEKCGMVTVSDKFSRGSVEVARGGRMTVVKKPGGKGARRATILKEVRKHQRAERASQSGRGSSSSREGARGRGRAVGSFSSSSSDSESDGGAAASPRHGAEGGGDRLRKRSMFKRWLE